MKHEKETATSPRHHLDKRAARLAREGETGGDPDDLLSSTQLAEWLGVSVQWVEIGRHRGYGPKFIRLSPRRVRYSRRAVLEYLAERLHARTSEYTQPTAAPAAEAGQGAAGLSLANIAGPHKETSRRRALLSPADIAGQDKGTSRKRESL